MSQSNPGRPSKPESKKRQQLHINVYGDDLERLDQSTANRSEFLRNCIKSEWEKEHGDDVMLSLTLPRWLVCELIDAVTPQIPRRHRRVAESLLEGMLAQAPRQVDDGKQE